MTLIIKSNKKELDLTEKASDNQKINYAKFSYAYSIKCKHEQCKFSIIFKNLSGYNDEIGIYCYKNKYKKKHNDVLIVSFSIGAPPPLLLIDNFMLIILSTEIP